MGDTKLEALIPNIMVEDVNETIKYYEKFARDGVNLMLQKRKSIVDEYPKFHGQAVGGALIFYISVKDIESLYAELELQVTIYTKLHKTFYGRKEFTIEDCNGYLLTFAEDSR